MICLIYLYIYFDSCPLPLYSTVLFVILLLVTLFPPFSISFRTRVSLVVIGRTCFRYPLGCRRGVVSVRVVSGGHHQCRMSIRLVGQVSGVGHRGIRGSSSVNDNGNLCDAVRNPAARKAFRSPSENLGGCLAQNRTFGMEKKRRRRQRDTPQFLLWVWTDRKRESPYNKAGF